MRRAQAVKKAFVDYGLPENIISIRTRALPRFPSNQDYQDGVIENQRVDIIVKNAPLQEYVDLRSYYEVIGKVRHDVDFLNVPQDDSVLFSTSFSSGSVRLDAPGTVTTEVTKRVNTDSEIISFSANANIKDLKSRANASIDVSSLPRRLVDLNLDNFEAILTYDYDQSFLSDDNKGLLKQLCEFLPAGCTIILFGSADAMGMESRNIQLEKERAEVVESFIKNISGDKFRIERDRSRFAKFDESTSQGRFLNRCFRIKLRK
jgi:outer membrane protein OmpA-like peptidoglycan-associated protein